MAWLLAGLEESQDTMNGLAGDGAKGRARVRAGDRQDGRQQTRRSGGVTGQLIVEDKAGARAGQGMARVIAGQRRIGHRMSRGHVGGQGTRNRAGMTTRAEPDLSPEQNQNCTNKSQGGGAPRAGWRAQQAKQGAEWEAAQNDWCCRNNCRAGGWRSRR